jgi:hypothetical protein
MMTKVDLSPVETLLTNVITPDYMVPVLIEIEERYLSYVLRDPEGIVGDVDTQLYYIREFRKALQRVLGNNLV